MLRELRRRLTLASFDYQWSRLPEGDAMLSDDWFAARADAILADELIAIDRSWFTGRRALDAGCGGGRWTLALLRLGCRVTALDASAGALATTRTNVERLAPDALRAGRLELVQGDLLALPPDILARRFDLVFSFGVLHHTGDTRAALAAIAGLVEPTGLLFLYLYGAATAGMARRAALAVGRTVMGPLPFRVRAALLARVFPERDLHQAFDLFSPAINDRVDLDSVTTWLRELGFDEVERTIDHTELFLRAFRRRDGLPLLAPGPPPYWFDRYAR